MGPWSQSSLSSGRFQFVSQVIFIALLIDNWNEFEYPFKKLEFGKWELVIPPTSGDGKPVIPHLSKIKVTDLLFFSVV